MTGGAERVRWLMAAADTVRASWWRRRMARLFGRPVEGHDGLHRCYGRLYRGQLYLVDFEEVAEADGDVIAEGSVGGGKGRSA